MTTDILVATDTELLAINASDGVVKQVGNWEDRRPTCLAASRDFRGRVWCGTNGSGLLRSDDGGKSWRSVGPEGRQITAVAVSPADSDLVWAGTEPSAVWRSVDGGKTWEELSGLADLPSSPEWSFPPRPHTHHVRWIACHPFEADVCWVAIEAGALIYTPDGGASWRDRVPGGPRDTHELAIHPDEPDTLRSAAGDGYFESRDGGATWSSPDEGLEVGYLRSVAIQPDDAEVVVISAASSPRSAYMPNRSDGRLYRRAGDETWSRVVDGWPRSTHTIAPLLLSGPEPGQMFAADERGVHVSVDGGRKWELVAAFPATPSYLRGITII